MSKRPRNKRNSTVSTRALRVAATCVFAANCIFAAARSDSAEPPFESDLLPHGWASIEVNEAWTPGKTWRKSTNWPPKSKAGPSKAGPSKAGPEQTADESVPKPKDGPLPAAEERLRVPRITSSSDQQYDALTLPPALTSGPSVATAQHGISQTALTIPTTQYSGNRFKRALDKHLEAVAKSAAPPQPSRLPSPAIPPSALASALKRQREVQASEAELAEAERLPRTDYDQERFDQSLTESLDDLAAMLHDGQATKAAPQHRAPATEPTAQRATQPLGGFHVRESAESLPLASDFSQLPHARTNTDSVGRLAGHPQPTAKRKELPFDQPSGRSPGYCYNDFSPTPIPQASTSFDSSRESWVYDARSDVKTQKPLVQLGREWYGNGITPNGLNWFGDKNMVRPKFYVYGDYRVGLIGGRNANGRTDNLAKRLNLDFDLQVTDTDRFHMFINPLEEQGRNTRIELVGGDLEFEPEFNLTPATGFYEGDLGVLLGTLRNQTSPFELPFTAGLIPLLFQNGIWMEDAVAGAAFALPARHSRLLNISNMDITFFAGFDQINTPAFRSDSAGQVFGTAAFIEAYDGYIEAGYAFLNERKNDDLDYHNMTVSYTRRYFDRLSNSVRVIINSGQDAADADRTADGGILFVENSLITPRPLTWVPYANFFYGWDRPQSVARAAGSGGLLRNTGINFQSDGVNGFAFLDDTGVDTLGYALGVDLIGDQLDRQLVLEFAYQTPHGNKNLNVPDDQYALGSRYQFNLDNASLIRLDAMYGWRRGLQDIYGTRVEYRWKF